MNFQGVELWNITTGLIHPFASPASSDQMLYFPGGDPALYCVDIINSHDLLWKSPADSQIQAGPTLGEDMVFYVTKKTIQALNATTGPGIWSAEINGIMSTPAISFDRVYVGSDDHAKGHLSCYNAKNGTLIWRTEANGPVQEAGRSQYGDHHQKYERDTGAEPDRQARRRTGDECGNSLSSAERSRSVCA